MNNPKMTPEKVRQFLLTRYCEKIQGKGRNPVDLPDSFDFLLEGIVDSFGLLEMVSALEKEFDVELDMAALDAEQMTILGPLSHYVAQNAKSEREGQDAPSFLQ